MLSRLKHGGRRWRDEQLEFGIKLNFVMVFSKSLSMASSREHQGPSPPTIEQILEDLSLASDQDVVFVKSPLVSEFASVGSDASNQGKLDGNFLFC